MSEILINYEESKEKDDFFAFIKSLNSDMQEKLKVVIWWENLKQNQQK